MSSLEVLQRSFARVDITLSNPGVNPITIRGVAKYPLLGKILKKLGYASKVTVDHEGVRKKYFVNTKSFIKHLKLTDKKYNLPTEKLSNLDLAKIKTIFQITLEPFKNKPQDSFNSSIDTALKTDTPVLSIIAEKLETEMPEANEIKDPPESSTDHDHSISLEPASPPIPVPLILLPNGNSYIGELNENGQPHGKGKESNYLGTIFEGTYQNGLREGQGVEYENDKEIYQGGYTAGLRSGYGIEHEIETTYDNGLFFQNYSLAYKGTYAKGLREGIGEEYQCDCIIYKGDYKAGKRDGMGKEYENNCVAYDGSYKAGERNGKGKKYIVLYNIVTKSYKATLAYSGEFKRGAKHGSAKEVYINGDTYIGSFVNNRREGQGKYIFSKCSLEDRLELEGTFKKDSFLEGICRYVNGDIYEGQMCNEKRHGKGKLIPRDNAEIKYGVWKNNELNLSFSHMRSAQ